MSEQRQYITQKLTCPAGQDKQRNKTIYYLLRENPTSEQMCFCMKIVKNCYLLCNNIMKIWSLDFPAITDDSPTLFLNSMQEVFFSGIFYFTSSINRLVIHVILFLKTLQ